MATKIYNDHLIVTRTEFHSKHDDWSCAVLISARHKAGDVSFHYLHPEQRFQSATAAEEFGMDLGQAWIDKRL